MLFPQEFNYALDTLLQHFVWRECDGVSQQLDPPQFWHKSWKSGQCWQQFFMASLSNFQTEVAQFRYFKAEKLIFIIDIENCVQQNTCYVGGLSSWWINVDYVITKINIL
jgi:hypothetical protein